jgi:hypothetical protein
MEKLMNYYYLIQGNDLQFKLVPIRMFLFFRFLATGDSFSTIGHSFRMGFSTVSSIVAEVCDVIWQRLQPTYMQKYGRKQYLDFKKSGTFQTVSEALMANM